MKKIRKHISRLFTKGDRLLKTDTRYIAKGGFWLMLSKGGNIFLGLILSVAFANLLAKEVFGTYQFILALASIISGFTLTGLGFTVMREAAQGNAGALRAGVILKLKWSIGIVLAALAGALYYFVNDNYTLATSLLIVGAFSPFFESFRLYNGFLTGRKEFKKNTLYGIGRKSLTILALLITLLLTDSPVVLILVYFATNTLALGTLYLKLQKEYVSQQGLSGETINYTKHISALNILGLIAGNIDKVLIFHFLGAAPLATYAFAKLVPSQLQGANQVIRTLAFPKIANHSVPELKKILPRKAGFLFVINLFIVALYILAAPLIYKLLFPQYTDAILFSQIIALGTLFTFVTLYKQTFGAHLKVFETYLIRVGVPLGRIAFLLVLLPLFGIWGAIAALLLTQILNAALILFLFKRL